MTNPPPQGSAVIGAIVLQTGAVNEPPPSSSEPGYWMASSTGAVYAFGHVRNFGSARTKAVSHIEPTPTHGGYWIVNRAGQVYAFGNAHYYGNAFDPHRGRDGQQSFGDTDRKRLLDVHQPWPRPALRRRPFYGDMSGKQLHGPVVGSVATPTGHGYFMVGTDGGVFSFGDAKFHGSMGGRASEPARQRPRSDRRQPRLLARRVRRRHLQLQRALPRLHRRAPTSTSQSSGWSGTGTATSWSRPTAASSTSRTRPSSAVSATTPSPDPSSASPPEDRPTLVHRPLRLSDDRRRLTRPG